MRGDRSILSESDDWIKAEPMLQRDALIFDIDGTLWDASAASAKGWNRGLAKLGIDRTVSAAQIKAVAGHPFEQCLDRLFPALRVQYPALLQTLNEYETEAVKAEGGTFFDGVRVGIVQLARTYQIFLVNNCQAWYLNLFLDCSSLRPVLVGVDCHGMSGLPKHEMLARLTRTHGLINPVYIGDTASDETAARIAGMGFIYMAWGFGKPEGEPRTVHSFSELLKDLRAEGQC